MDNGKKEIKKCAAKTRRRQIKCPSCGKRIMDASHTTKTKFAAPAAQPDFVMKCGCCGAEVGVIKLE